MRLGVIGAGTIARAAITGFCAAEVPIAEIWLSPRNAAVAAELARTHENAHVAKSNQGVLDRCDVIIVSVRPRVAHDVLEALRFRPNHRVISLVAGFSHAMLEPLVSPAARVVRAVPLPAVAMRQGPTVIFPPNDTARALFSPTGTTVEVTTEGQFDALLAVTAEMAAFFELQGTCSDWLVKAGVDGQSASRFVAAMFQALAATAAREEHPSFPDLVREHMTRGGLNEQVHRRLGDAGVFDQHGLALDAVLARLKGSG